jgi:ABC-type transport system substrate-binding protein
MRASPHKSCPKDPNAPEAAIPADRARRRIARRPARGPRAGNQSDPATLRFVPRYDAGVLDPHWSTSAGTRNHAFLVYDTLYGLDAHQQPRPQMLAGHVVEEDGLRWTLTLRDGPAAAWPATVSRSSNCAAAR